MKQVYIIRHSYAKHTSDSGSDKDRSLKQKGKEVAMHLAEYISAHGITADVILCSSTRRTKETADIIQRALRQDITEEPLLYDASAGDVYSLLSDLPESVESVAIIGHNPTAQQFSVLFSAHPQDAQDKGILYKVTPGSLIGFSYKGRWEDIQPGSATITHVIQGETLADEANAGKADKKQ